MHMNESFLSELGVKSEKRVPLYEDKTKISQEGIKNFTTPKWEIPCGTYYNAQHFVKCN